jgi:anti-sigma factor RsiW
VSISDEDLMAYADGELDTKTRAQVEEAMAADPQIARRVAEHKALRHRLRSSYDKVLDEPVPDRLVAAARGRASSPTRRPGDASGAADNRGADNRGADNRGADNRGADNRGADNRWAEGRRAGGPAADSRGVEDRGVVIPLRPKHAKAPSLPYWGAIAASFVVGALVWHFGGELYSSGPVIERNGQLLASGALDKALSTQLVREQQGEPAVQIGVSFRAKNGNYCRTFQLRESNNLAGLACRQEGKWRLEVLAEGEASAAGHPELRQAGSSLPPAIAEAVDATIEGEPLDAQAEARARTNGWRQ